MIKVVFDEAFYPVYDHDPAAAAGRMEAIVRVIEGEVEFVDAAPASEAQIGAIHTEGHIAAVRRQGLYEIAALAAGATIQAAEIGLDDPCFALDWGRLLATEDYTRIGRLVRQTTLRSGGGCFAVLEGGYNHSVLGYNVLALLQGLTSA